MDSFSDYASHSKNLISSMTAVITLLSVSRALRQSTGGTKQIQRNNVLIALFNGVGIA